MSDRPPDRHVAHHRRRRLGWAMFKWAEPPSVKGLPNGDRACTFCIVLAVWPLVILFALACAALED